MKFKKILITIAFSLSLLLPALTFAKVCSNDPSTDNELCNPIVKVGGDNFTSFAIRVLRVFAGFVGTATIIYVMFSGFRFIISQGNSEDVETAKRALQWSLSGLAVMLLSYVLIVATRTFFGVKAIPESNNPVLTNPIAANTFDDLYLVFINGFFGIVGILAVLMIVINGVRYMTAGGNDEQAESAKSGLQYAVGGVIIVILAYVLVRATATFFGGA